MLYSMGKKTPRSKIKQNWARKHTFQHNQYWCLVYTECYKGGKERDFKIFVKARSSDLALNILMLRLQEDDTFLKVRSVTTSIVHDCWHVGDLGRKLSVKEWESIRNVSFPNDWNRIFKFEKKRTKDQFNRFNVPHKTLPKEHNRKFQKASKKMVEKYLVGSFKPACPKLRKICYSDEYCENSSRRRGYASLQNKDHKEMELAYLKKIMKKYHGNVNWAADATSISAETPIGVESARRSLRNALKRFPEVDWHKEFPLTRRRVCEKNAMDNPESRAKLSQSLRKIGHKPPPNIKGTEQYKKWRASSDATWKVKKAKLYSDWKKRLAEALRKHNNKRLEASGELGISKPHFSRLLRRFAAEDEEFRKEFYLPEILEKARVEASIKTKRSKYLSNLKRNKHSILQAYYQNGESDCEAGKVLNVGTRTVTKAREDIEKYKL
jgi:hypothetical protein